MMTSYYDRSGKKRKDILEDIIGFRASKCKG